MIVDEFAGPGGWDEGLLLAGYTGPVLGIEKDELACATAIAAGHPRLQLDIRDVNPAQFRGVVGQVASPPCFIAGTPVLTRRGMTPIEDVAIGDEVWTHKGRWRKVTDTMSRTADVVRIGPITATADHPFYSRPQVYYRENKTRKWFLGDPVWTPAADAQGMFLASPTRIDEVSEWESMPVDPWLAGRYVADGWTGRDGLMIAVGAGKVEEFVRRTEGRPWKVSMPSKSCFRYTQADHEAAQWLRENCGHGAGNKTIPVSILAAPAAVREEFLAGYLSGDGTRGFNGWVANTVSSSLAASLRLLGLSLGYTSQIREQRTPDTTVIEGRTVSQRNYWSVRIGDRGPERSTRTENGLHWFKQRKAVTPAGSDVVYDITVDEDHSFVAWGYVVHNCQAYSTSGKGKGRDTAHLLIDGLRGIQRAGDVSRLIEDVEEDMTDERSSLVVEPLRFALELRPEWIAWEQVPPVLPIWQACADVLSANGYSVETGILSAEQYGVPQTRRRAILVARRHDIADEFGPAKLPAPTHSRFSIKTPTKLQGGLPRAVSIADAMGPEWRPERAPKGSLGPWQFCGAGATARTTAGQIPRDLDMPAHTITGKATAAWTVKYGEVGSGYNVTVEESAVLQSFRRDYPWQGKQVDQYRMVGDAIPPKLAEAVLRSVMPNIEEVEDGRDAAA